MKTTEPFYKKSRTVFLRTLCILACLTLCAADMTLLAQVDRFMKISNQPHRCKMLQVTALQGGWPGDEPRTAISYQQEETEFLVWPSEFVLKPEQPTITFEDYNLTGGLVFSDATSLILGCIEESERKGLDFKSKFRRKNRISKLEYEVSDLKWEQEKVEFQIRGKGKSKFDQHSLSFPDDRSMTWMVKETDSNRRHVFVFTARELVTHDYGDSDVVFPKLIKKVAPEYPNTFKGVSSEEVVIFAVDVDEEGVPRLDGARVYHCPHPVYLRSTFEAVSQWRYSPLIVDGEPRELSVSISVHFVLRQ